MHDWVHECMLGRIHACLDACKHSWVDVHVCMYMYTSMPRWMDVCMHACMHACSFVSLYVCMNVHGCMHACLDACKH